jgi:ribosomal protein S18 acetylase RimI-like enzyme
MAFIVRPGEREDAARIALVHVESWKSTYRGIVPESYLADLDAESRAAMWKEQLASDEASILVAEDESGIVGFAASGRLRESVAGYGDSYDAELYAIYLLRPCQRQGVSHIDSCAG